MKFRDLEIGQTFTFLPGYLFVLGIGERCVKTGPGSCSIEGAPGYVLSKSQRDVNVEPIGEPPAPEPRVPDKEELLAMLSEMDPPDLETVVAVLRALVRRS